MGVPRYCVGQYVILSLILPLLHLWAASRFIGVLENTRFIKNMLDAIIDHAHAGKQNRGPGWRCPAFGFFESDGETMSIFGVYLDAKPPQRQNIGETQVCFDTVTHGIVQGWQAGNDIDFTGSIAQSYQHALLPAVAVDITGGFSLPYITQSEEAIHVVCARLQGFIHKVRAAWLGGKPPGNRTIHRYVDSTQSVDEIFEAFEVDLCVMVDADTEISLDGICQESDAATVRILVEGPPKRRCIDAVLTDRGDTHPQISGERDDANFAIGEIHCRHHHDIRSPGSIGVALIGTDEKDVKGVI